MYVLLEGEIDIFLGDFLLETAGPGALLGEMALIDDSPRTANAVAKSPSRLAQIDRRRFHLLVQQTPHFATHVMKIFGPSPASHERRDGRAITSLERRSAPFAAARAALSSANANGRAVSAFCRDRYDRLRPTGPDGCRFRSATPADGRATVEATRHQGRTRGGSDGEGAARGVCSDGCAIRRVRGTGHCPLVTIRPFPSHILLHS